MPFAPFFQRFPDAARRETRSITVLNDDSLPRGTYAFVELFCSDEHCDCRRVFIQVVHGEEPTLSRPLA